MGMLRIDWNVVATIVNLIVLYYLMRHFLFKPVMNIMDERKKLIDSQFSEAKEVQDSANEMKEQYQGMLSGAKEESRKIVEDARGNAQTEYETKLESANMEAEKILESAREKIELEKNKMLHELESQISSLAMCAAGKVLGKNASPKYDSDLYDQFISEAGEKNDATRN